MAALARLAKKAMGKISALVVNSGSSSVKYGLFDLKEGGALEGVCSGLVDKIGLEGCVIKHTGADGKTTKTETPLPDHGAALKAVAELLTGKGGPVADVSEIKVVGHRVVHGGTTFSGPAVIDDAAEKEIEKCAGLAPLHNPPNLLGIRMAKQFFPACPHVGVFDTAFHATMPPESYRYAVPKELYEKYGVRRYGFHGTSYKYVSQAAADMLKRPLRELNMIICHLGNGCSMACIKQGQCVDTTMGLTPLEGLVMGTRCGDLDAGAFSFFSDSLKMTPKEIDTMLNKKSGLLGIAGKSDMREVIEAGKKGDQDAILARNVYKERIRKYIGAYLVKVGGLLDAIVFTAGVGENDKGMRELALADLGALGIFVDGSKNATVDGAGEIQAPSSKVKVLAIPTQEELCIAQQSLELCELSITMSGFSKPAAKL